MEKIKNSRVLISVKDGKLKSGNSVDLPDGNYKGELHDFGFLHNKRACSG